MEKGLIYVPAPATPGVTIPPLCSPCRPSPQRLSMPSFTEHAPPSLAEAVLKGWSLRLSTHGPGRGLTGDGQAHTVDGSATGQRFLTIWSQLPASPFRPVVQGSRDTHTSEPKGHAFMGAKNQAPSPEGCPELLLREPSPEHQASGPSPRCPGLGRAGKDSGLAPQSPADIRPKPEQE